ncbi:MAG: 50S ribosomal protein L23 [Patescibacteria group bacterium]
MKFLVKQPLLTEKTLTLATTGWYTFVVPAAARKGEIASAVEKLYGVKVTSVRTVKMPSKTRRRGRRLIQVETGEKKKALVKLAKGQTIEAFTKVSEGVKGQ